MNAKSQGMYEYYKNATAHHVPLHGIGFESHVHIDTLPDMDSVAANMERFIALGIEIHVTELDVSLNNTLDTIAAGWEAEAKFYGEYLAVCIHHAPGCHSFETWGITDRYSWLGCVSQVHINCACGTHTPEPMRVLQKTGTITR